MDGVELSVGFCEPLDMVKAAFAASFKLRVFLAWLPGAEPVTDGPLELRELCEVGGRSRAVEISCGSFVLFRMDAPEVDGRSPTRV
jgi:hypothetical protein